MSEPRVENPRKSENQGKKGGWSSRIRWIGTILSIVLLVWLLRNQDWEALFRTAASIPLILLFASLFFFVTFQLANTGRWLSLLRAQTDEIHFRRAMELVFAGRFASNFLPSSIGGDVIRAVGVYPYLENALTASASVVLDRLISVFGRLFFLPFAIPIVSVAWTKAAVDATLSAGFSAMFFDRIRSVLRKVRDSVDPWRNNPSALFSSLLFSWLGVLFDFLSTYMIVLGLGMDLTFWEVMGVVALTHAATTIPISINAYGFRELTIVAVVQVLGIPLEQAAALAIVTRGLSLIASFPGVLWIGGLLDDWKRSP